MLREHAIILNITFQGLKNSDDFENQPTSVLADMAWEIYTYIYCFLLI